MSKYFIVRRLAGNQGQKFSTKEEAITYAQKENSYAKHDYAIFELSCVVTFVSRTLSVEEGPKEKKA